MRTVPVLLLTGYLGSGKTTLLNHILTNGEGIRFAVIVNDLGEVNIDASLIQKGGIVGQDGGDNSDLVALQNGCICCTLRADLMKQIMELVDSMKFDYIVIEASGICEPEPIAQTIVTLTNWAHQNGEKRAPRLDCIVTVVDAMRLVDEWDCGATLQRPDLDEEEIENLIVQQIEFCNKVLLNKVDEVTPLEADGITQVIEALNPGVEVIRCNYCDVPFKELVDTNMFNFSKTATSATWVKLLDGELPQEEEEGHEHHHEHEHEHEHEHDHHHHHHHHDHEHGEAEEYGVQTMVYFTRKPFDLNKFDYLVASQWPKNIIRVKGITYFSHNRDMSILFETAGRQKSLKEAGQWYATAPKEELEQFLRQDPSLKRDWDEEYGDRMTKLVIIGRNLDREAITRAFDNCLAE